MFAFDKTPAKTTGAERAALLLARKIVWQQEFYSQIASADDIGAPSRQVLRHQRRRDIKRLERPGPRSSIQSPRKSRKSQV